MLEALDAVLDAAAAALDPRFSSANWWLAALLVVGVVWFTAFSIASGSVTPLAWPGAGIAIVAALLLTSRVLKSSGRNVV